MVYELKYSCSSGVLHQTGLSLPSPLQLIQRDVITCWVILNFTFPSLWTQFGCSGGNNAKQLLYLEKPNLGSSVRPNPWRLRESPVLLTGSKSSKTAVIPRINIGNGNFQRNTSPLSKTETWLSNEISSIAFLKEVFYTLGNLFLLQIKPIVKRTSKGNEKGR